MERYFEPGIECASRDQITRLQDERLAATVKRVYETVPYYKNKMDEAGVSPADIQGVRDLHKLPFLSKEDLRKQYPYGLLAKPLSECVRIHSTSGTTGRRVVAFYTQNDIDLWEECCARAITAAGGTKEDVVQVCYGYGLFTGGAGLHGGSHKVGSLTLPMSSGNTDRQIQFMTDLGATIICCTPSYAAYLAESIIERGERDRIKLKAGIFGAEAWTEEMRQDIQNKLGIKAYDIYGLTEISGPGVAFECLEKHGMHINEDNVIAEIINPTTGEQLPYGMPGELVFTTITKTGQPMIRYRTHDICTLTADKCACGRTLARMGRITGRTDDMLVIRGVNVFPSQIESVLVGADGVAPHYMLIVDRVNSSDTLEVQVEMTEDMFGDTVAHIENVRKYITDQIKSVVGIASKVKLVAPKSIPRSEGKAKRVIDNRKL